MTGEGNGSRSGQETRTRLQVGSGVQELHQLPSQEQEQQVQQQDRRHVRRGPHHQRQHQHHQPQHCQGGYFFLKIMINFRVFDILLSAVFPFLTFYRIICVQ